MTRLKNTMNRNLGLSNSEEPKIEEVIQQASVPFDSFMISARHIISGLEL
jgi:hypothetical protein